LATNKTVEASDCVIGLTENLLTWCLVLDSALLKDRVDLDLTSISIFSLAGVVVLQCPPGLNTSPSLCPDGRVARGEGRLAQ